MSASISNQPPITFKGFALFAGLGGGTLGGMAARAMWSGVQGSIEYIGAIDSDAHACEDYRKLTGSSITCMDLFDRDQYREFHGKEPAADWREATAADVRAAAGGECPDIVFTSPPCKGFSGLLPNKSAESSKYQALNRLTIRSIRLTLEAFADSPPRVILLENVPRIKTRGIDLLNEIKRLLRDHGYTCHDADHDCGEIGGLGQRRKRYLLIARHIKSCKPFIYQPPTRPLKTIGDVIGPLPLPDDPSMGPMHRLPRLKWLTWLRLALIPAGGDWRDLQKIAPEEYRLGLDTSTYAGSPGLYGVSNWDQPSPAITGSASVSSSNSPAAIADPRLNEAEDRHHNKFRVSSPDKPAPCVTGSRFGSGALAISDPRVNQKSGRHHSHYRVTGFEEPGGTVTSATHVANGTACIADPRLPTAGGTYPNRFAVRTWAGPAACITGDTDIQCGAQSIADVRLGHEPRPGVYRVLRMDEASGAVVGGQGVGVSNGPSAVADHRLGCAPRAGSYGVMGWNGTAPAVIGSANCHAANVAVADPRIPGNNERLDPPPVIISLDGTWHRPLTTMELLALQSFPLQFPDGRPIVLAGKSDSKWRERIGNAVPPEASRRIHEQIVLALLQNEIGDTFTLGNTPIWVQPGEKSRTSSKGRRISA